MFVLQVSKNHVAPIDFEQFLKDNYSEIVLDSCKKALEFPNDDIIVEFRDRAIRTITPVLLDSKLLFAHPLKYVFAHVLVDILIILILFI